MKARHLHTERENFLPFWVGGFSLKEFNDGRTTLLHGKFKSAQYWNIHEKLKVRIEPFLTEQVWPLGF